LIELWKKPVSTAISLLSNNTVLTNSGMPPTTRDVVIDYGTTLINLVPTFQAAFRILTEEFCFKSIEARAEGTTVRWLNANLSLQDQRFSEKAVLVLVPQSVILKVCYMYKYQTATISTIVERYYNQHGSSLAYFSKYMSLKHFSKMQHE
jgi:hypothetical protein